MSSAEHRVDNVSRETPARRLSGFTLGTQRAPAIYIEGYRHRCTFPFDGPEPFGKGGLQYCSRTTVA